MSRDWQKDMELGQQAKDWEFYITFDGCGDIEENGSTIASDVGVSQAGTIFDALEALPYWLQQYAAEKERADKAEEREEELKSAIAYVMENNLLYDAIYAYEHFEEILDSLYTKEETKP